MKGYCFVADIGGTMIKYGVMNEKQEFIYKDTRPTNANLGGESIIRQIRDCIRTLQDTYELDAITIATAGQVDPLKGVIAYASDAIPNYTGVNIKEMLSVFNLPVFVENDVNCALLAEMSHLPKDKNVVMITVGTGIGGALFIHNQLVHSESFSAGEVGYIPLHQSTFQDCASTSALIKKVEEYSKVSGLNGKQVFSMAESDANIQEIINEFYDDLAQGIAAILFVVAPDYFVIGGAISSRTTFIDEITSRLQRILPPHMFDKVEVQRAMYDNDAGMIGAFYLKECTNE